METVEELPSSGEPTMVEFVGGRAGRLIHVGPKEREKEGEVFRISDRVSKIKRLGRS